MDKILKNIIRKIKGDREMAVKDKKVSADVEDYSYYEGMIDAFQMAIDWVETKLEKKGKKK